MSEKVSLRGSFFTGYALWQIIGVAGYFNSLFLTIYLIGLVALTVITVIDRSSLLSAKKINAKLISKSSYVIGESIELILYFEVSQKLSMKPSGLYWLVPKTSVLHFERKQLNLLKNAEDRDLGYEINVIGVNQNIGFDNIRNIEFRSQSRLGIWENQFNVPVDEMDIRIHPPEGLMTDAEFFEKVSKQKIFSSGMRKLLKSRSKDQFLSIRKYQFPDSRRSIDAKKSAKYQQLMTRLFEEYQAHHLVIALDCSRNMLGYLGESHKIDYYISACLKLAESALASGDKVSLIAFSDHLHYTIKGARSRADFYGLYQGGSVFQPNDAEPNYSLLPNAISKVTQQRAMVFVLTDPSMPSVHKEIQKNMFPICKKHFSVIIGLNDESRFAANFVSEVSPYNPQPEDVSRLLYNIHIEDELDKLTAHVNRWGGGVVRSTPDDWLAMTKKAYKSLKNSLTA